jgi:cytochrome c-type biogenesis protein CcmF
MNAGQPGDLAIFLSLGMALLSGAGFFITAIGLKNLARLATRAYYLQIVFVTSAVVYLSYLFFIHDFGIEYVYSYSSTDLPFSYLLSSFWAGQEGTYLLWLFFSGLFGLIILHKSGRYKTWGMAFYSLINLFLIIMLLTLSPFRPLGFSAAEGAGLNPLLQDPWMVIHPPVMFIAFSMAGVPFAVALAAMIRRDTSIWLKTAFPYIEITSLALAVANVLGGFWAYKTLGWGGYWAWDPVENTSFVPWLVSLGLIHGMIIEKRSGALKRTNMVLAALVFILVVYGTFLTRSGVLADFSVHSFVDLGVNSLLIAFIALFALLTLVIYFYSLGGETAGNQLNSNIYSRDFLLYIGMLLLFIFGVVVLFWSSLPLITGFLSSTPAAAKIATYNDFAFPLAIAISLFLTLSPAVTGPGYKVRHLAAKLAPSLLISSAVSAAVYFLKVTDLTITLTLLFYMVIISIYLPKAGLAGRTLIALVFGLLVVAVALILGVKLFDYLFFIAAAAAAVAANGIALKDHFPNNIRAVGGHLAHLGYGLMLLGILASSAFTFTEKLILPRDEKRSALGVDFTYRGTTGTFMDKDNAIIIALDENGDTTEVFPGFYFSRKLNGIMKKPHIKRELFYDLYMAPQEIREMPGSQGLVLKKGQAQTIGEYTIRFVDFDILPHSSSAAMSVGARLEVTHNSKMEKISPYLAYDPSGGTDNIESRPVRLFSNSDYRISIRHVYADNGAVVLSIPGLIESGPPDKLIVDVSVKPGMNLLWLGAIFVFAGMAFSATIGFKK